MIRTSVEKQSNEKAPNNRDLSPVASPQIMNIAPTTLALAQKVSDQRTESQQPKYKQSPLPK